MFTLAVGTGTATNVGAGGAGGAGAIVGAFATGSSRGMPRSAENVSGATSSCASSISGSISGSGSGSTTGGATVDSSVRCRVQVQARSSVCGSESANGMPRNTASTSGSGADGCGSLGNDAWRARPAGPSIGGSVTPRQDAARRGIDGADVAGRARQRCTHLGCAAVAAAVGLAAVRRGAGERADEHQVAALGSAVLVQVDGSKRGMAARAVMSCERNEALAGRARTHGQAP